ncbi:ferredoxin subunit of nitrite reductase and ring-hydroxylating dioxygenase [Beggiatoa alba B18LD]|uniref:Ferredoxin subunit of nitrite reductase and ring-hydroxylating dioxygenase n=1 Tax=Beggiatoa alba B18LD TaxID=395493 RepID=I3CI33_9GAMM|nr:Rieske (2Fe-2S) protein [Beggiatoa alba]EIJ43276.1 ferredoxin subunit of nitrite reductase and ring-hydroxylating dioxygenase [Beggiatoa alba B18LD]
MTSIQHWQPVAEIYDIPQQGMISFEISGLSLLFSRQGQQVSCFANSCTHLDRPLDMGNVCNGVVTCPFHGYEFELETGRCLNASSPPLKSYPVRIVENFVQVCLVEDTID